MNPFTDFVPEELILMPMGLVAYVGVMNQEPLEWKRIFVLDGYEVNFRYDTVVLETFHEDLDLNIYKPFGAYMVEPKEFSDAWFVDNGVVYTFDFHFTKVGPTRPKKVAPLNRGLH